MNLKELMSIQGMFVYRRQKKVGGKETHHFGQGKIVHYFIWKSLTILIVHILVEETLIFIHHNLI